MVESLLNTELWISSPRLVAGIMTGTSLDGIDVALARFQTMDNNRHSMDVMAYITIPYPENIRDIIAGITEGRAGIREISHIHFLLPRLYAESLGELCSKTNFNLTDLDAIGIHGQTIWHEPPALDQDAFAIPSTFQSGSASALAQLTGKPVVADFRAADIALGGQGAPLVPIFDFEFLSDASIDVIALNIGGMANITIMPPGCGTEDIRAFDTGPGNILIDLAMQKYYGTKYDRDGKKAALGKRIDPLMQALQKIDFVWQEPPKSTGREYFNYDLLNEYIERYARDASAEDIIRTLTEFTAWSIAENIRLFAKPDSKIIVSGGGLDNPTLMYLLEQELPLAKVTSSTKTGIHSDAKEALCFAYLAYRTLAGLPGSLHSVTGAKREAVLGVIAMP